MGDIYKIFFEQSNDLVLVYEKNGRVVDVILGENYKAYNSFLKFKGQLVSEVLPPTVAVKKLSGIQKAKQKNEKVTIFFTLDKLGKTFYYEERFYPVTGDRVLGIVRDITELKEKEIALQKYANQLKNSNENLKRLVYSISHDLKEPVRSITSFSQLTAKKMQHNPDPDVRAYLNYLVNSGKRLNDTIEGLVRMTDLEDELVDDVVDCQIVITDVLEDLSLQIEESEAEIECEVLPEIKCTEHYIHQIFLNLVSNALKYRSPDRKLKLKIGSFLSSKNNYHFTFEDNGKGIEREYFDKIFDMFTQLDADSKYDGVGFGLALCKKIILKMGGEIWVESEVNVGSKVSFFIPTEVKRAEVFA